jgi:uncharacterized SAM-binding protein YcdF (DUF218 family)
MSWLATKIINAFLLPPLNLLVLSGVGIFLLTRRPRLGRNLIIVAWILLYVLSTPIVARTLIQTLETVPPLQPGAYTADEVGAIVVLAGGVYDDAPEYGGDSASPDALARVRYAARLQRATGKPILVTGGGPRSRNAESLVLKDALENDFFVPVRWVEDQSENTWQNARLSYAILQPQGITTVYLVTQAWHMSRAVTAFERAGFRVIPAPTGFTTAYQLSLLDFLPRGSALGKSFVALHEWMGQGWYVFG